MTESKLELLRIEKSKKSTSGIDATSGNYDQLFKWLSKTGMGVHFGNRPIGWYQMHQINALEVIKRKAKDNYADPEHVRVKAGVLQARKGTKWVPIAYVTEIFREADAMTRRA